MTPSRKRLTDNYVALVADLGVWAEVFGPTRLSGESEFGCVVVEDGLAK